MNIERATQLAETYIDGDTPAFLWSAPGIGKSSVVKQIAKSRGWGLVDFRAVLRDPVDLRGLPTIQGGDTAKWLSPDDLPQADRDGEEGIFFMDELNAAPPQMQAACFGLVLDRKVGNYTLPPKWRIVAAGNRQSDRAAAQKMPSALANRFAHIDVEADVEAFTKWANKNDIDPILIAFVRFRPNLIHVMDLVDQRAFPSPRSWEQAAKYVNAERTIRLDAVSGIVGEAAGGEFEGFIRTYQSLPSIDHCIMDPEGAKVPNEDDIAARYAITSALARRAEMTNFGNIMRYINRMPRTFATMLVVDACRRDAGLTHTQAFMQWARDNQDVTL
ncbi:MAG: hypothetical protein J0I99_00585 [Devosia sp.]|uniref:hypothetical protein n=1 Tax=Devosia sp. TaxID=1871048 RepID=UPI001AD4BDAC|nr:hypothetical protein [Devosia sp.]MBN9314213.1 hypothetical protein [Devosia sp.]